MAKVIKIGVGYGNPVPIFNLKRIKRADEQAFLADHADVKGCETDEEKERKQFETCVDAIANWSEDRKPTKSIANPEKKPGDDLPDTIEVPFFEGESSAAADVHRIFREAEEEGDDIFRSADLLIYHYRLQLQPDVLFP